MSSSADLEASGRHDWLEPDAVLALYVDATNRQTEPAPEGMWLTLTANGALISGELIPNWQWFAELADLTGGERSIHFGLGETLRKRAELLCEALEAKRAETSLTDAQEALVNAPTAYIHLRNARFFMPEPLPAEGHYWRGRLAEVSGWMAGRLASS